MERIVLCRGPGALGQEPDVCAALVAIQGGEPAGELARPVLDLDKLRELLQAERASRAPILSPSPLVSARLAPSPVAPGSPFERQVPIYLLPGQASAQAGFLVVQQSDPLLGPFLRRLFQLAPTEGG